MRDPNDNPSGEHSSGDEAPRGFRAVPEAAAIGHIRPEAFAAEFDLTTVPAAPGCYLMLDAKGQVIYVGKAANLRTRVRAYINEQDTRYRVKFLMRRVARIDFLVTTTEKEALLLENSLIKQHKPRYNVRLKDDKTYVRLRVDVQHPFPRITITRKHRKDGAKYFGPYASADAVRATLKHLQRLFPLRTCSDSVLANRSRPCLYYQMGQCPAPCVGLIDEEAYGQIVSQALMVLQGRSGELERQLRDQIQAHADALEFEQAAQLRDRLYALQQTLERQRTVQAAGSDDRDVIGMYTHGRYSEIQVLQFREGKMTGGRSVSFNQHEMPIEEMLGSFLLQYYSEAAGIPQEVLVPVPLEEADVLAEVLGEERGGRVVVHCPQRGDKRALIRMAERNARSSFEEKRLAEKANQDLLEQVRKALKLQTTPNRIECFDISTIQGNQAVGAMAVFEGGAPNKNRYRRYAIKQVEGQDDFAMLREVLLRRFRRAIDENDLPDLALIDGGKGQLNVARAVLQDLGIEDLEIAGIAKSRLEGEGGRSPERFFVPGRKDPIILPQNSPVVQFLARIRDEAHRFAITYHRKQRKSAALTSPLETVPGVGPKRAKALLRTLGSLKRVREASIETLAAVPGFNETLARQVHQYIAGNPNSEGGQTK